jgi:hypothetical protein
MRIRLAFLAYFIPNLMRGYGPADQLTLLSIALKWERNA